MFSFLLIRRIRMRNKRFSRVLGLGKRVIVYEAFYPQEKDNDKVRGSGRYFTMKEWKEIFTNL